MADLRGQAAPGAPPDPAKDGFSIDPDALVAALDAMVDALDARDAALRDPTPEGLRPGPQGPRPGPQGAPRGPEGPRLVDGVWVAPRTGPVLLRVRFAAGDTAMPYLAAGFARPERAGTWALAPAARLDFADFEPPGGPLWLQIEATGFVAPPHFTSHAIRIAVNGHDLGAWDMGGPRHVTIWLPAAVLGQRRGLQLAFSSDRVVSPLALGLSQDKRTLMLMLREIGLRRPAG